MVLSSARRERSAPVREDTRNPDAGSPRSRTYRAVCSRCSSCSDSVYLTSQTALLAPQGRQMSIVPVTITPLFIPELVGPPPCVTSGNFLYFMSSKCMLRPEIFAGAGMPFRV